MITIERTRRGAVAAWARGVNRPCFTPTWRDAIALPVGLLAFWLVWNGPPVDRLFGVDLRFGIIGPAVALVWHPLGAAALVAVVLFVERRRFSSLLLARPTLRDLEVAGYAFGLAMLAQWVLGMLAEPTTSAGVNAMVELGVAGVVAMIVVAAVTEEVVYRGYLAERFASLLRSRWAGAAVSLAVFVAPHVLFFGWEWLLGPAAGALAVAAVALARRNLPAAMLVHAGVNAPILIPTIAAG